MQDQTNMGNGDEIEFPVDDATYNLMQTLTSKLEALDAYRTYADDAGEDAAIYQELAQDEMRHAQRLLQALKQRLAQS